MCQDSDHKLLTWPNVRKILQEEFNFDQGTVSWNHLLPKYLLKQARKKRYQDDTATYS